MFALFCITDALASGPSCPSPIGLVPWTAELQAAEDAFARLDEPGFDAAMTDAGEDLACLSELLSPVIAARYHRLVGLRRFVRHDEDGARLAFAAARVADPYGALPSALLPPGHEARLLADSAETPGDTVPAPRPRAGALSFDGTTGRRRPVDRPTLFQIADMGAVKQTIYLGPTDPLPAYESSETDASHWAVGGVGAALLVGGAVTYGFALEDATTVRGDLPATTTRDEVVALQERANALTVASAVAGALGIVGIGVAVVRW